MKESWISKGILVPREEERVVRLVEWKRVAVGRGSKMKGNIVVVVKMCSVLAAGSVVVIWVLMYGDDVRLGDVLRRWVGTCCNMDTGRTLLRVCGR